MTVLVDTSVWVGHFKQRNDHLATLLEQGRVVCHPHVVLEIACGTPPDRHALIGMLTDLERVPIATQEEVLALIARHALHGRGCGFVDIHLIASSLLRDTTRIWTLDRRLDGLAHAFGKAYRPLLSS